jgi:hypothetical protein
MSTQNYAVLTSAERTAAMALNGEEQSVNPIPVNGSSPGVGININDAADGFSPGDTITLVGKYVVPRRVVTDPDYVANVPDLCAYLAVRPCAILENESIFAPQEPL